MATSYIMPTASHLLKTYYMGNFLGLYMHALTCYAPKQYEIVCLSTIKGMMPHWHTLLFLGVRFNFWFTAIHLPGEKNIAADFISRNLEK